MAVVVVVLLSKNAAITQLESISRSYLIELKRIESNRLNEKSNIHRRFMLRCKPKMKKKITNGFTSN